ncbi:MAG: agmatinase family protein [Deltaproteobacteria bacterium]|nr:agmatinase family protein [Deltaproteobacteria bacterium]
MLRDHDPDDAPPADAGIFGFDFSVDESALVLIPVPWDVTTSYRPGTAAGPDAILSASHQLDLWDVDLGEVWRGGITMVKAPAWIHDANRTLRVDAERVIAVGGKLEGDAELAAALRRVNEGGARLNAWVHDTAAQHIQAGKLVGVVGGDHSVPFGAIQRAAEEHGEVGILHIDAHADLRHAYEGFAWSHASIMRNVMDRIPQVQRLIQVGIRDVSRGEVDYMAASGDRIAVHYDQRLQERRLDGEAWSTITADIIDQLPPKIWLSFDIDGLDPRLCPNTGTPVPGGLGFSEALALIKRAAQHSQIIGFDLTEVAPGAAGDEWDGNVGARILYKLCGWALHTRTAAR